MSFALDLRGRPLNSVGETCSENMSRILGEGEPSVNKGGEALLYHFREEIFQEKFPKKVS